MRTIEQIQLYVANANVSLADYWAEYLQAKADGDPDVGFMGRRIGIIKLYLFTIQSYIDNEPTDVKTINSLFNSLLSYLPSDFFLSDYTFYNPLATNISGAVVISAAAKASNTIYGIVRLNVAPLLESDPVVLGANDPRIAIWDSAYALAEDAFNNRITSSVFNSLGQLVLTKADATTVTSTNSTILSQSVSAQTASFWITGQARASQFVVNGGLPTQFLKADGTLDSNVYLTGNQTVTLSGEASGSGATAISVTLSNAAVISKVLTGYVSGAGTVSSTDSLLTAIQKLNGNIGSLVTGVSSVFGRTGAVVAQSGDYTTAQVTESGNLYFTNARARASISESITGIDYNSTTGVFSLTAGYVIPTTTEQTNWNTAYTNRITSLTTTGNNGSASLSANTLNIPTYTLAGLGGQPLNTNLTSLSGLTYASTSFVKMTAAGTFALDTNTYLTGNQTITLSGEASGSGATAISVTLSNAAVIGKTLTGYTSGAGTVASTDTILQAIQKLNGNISALVTGVSSVSGTTNRITVSPTSGAVVVDIASTYVGQTSITTLGTIGTGVWQGSQIQDAYIASAVNWNTAYTNRITSLTTTGNSGAATLISNTLNIPNYTLAGLGGVPYTGATTNVDLGEYYIKAGYFAYDTTPSVIPTAQGATYWDDDEETVAIIMNGVTQRVGLDTYFNAKNSTGVTIPKGTAVRFAGTDGNSGNLLIAPMLADGTYPSVYYMGITAEAIGNGQFGKVMSLGKLRTNTNAYNDNDILYVSSTVAGGFQTTAPLAPNNIIIAAAVVNAANNGVLEVRATLGSNINNDEGVKITTPLTGQLLQLQSNGLWENKTKAQVLGGTSSQFVKGDGTLDSTSYTPTSRQLTINGTTYDLSANRTWTIPTHDAVTLGTANGLSLAGQVLSLGLSSSSANGALSSTDWSTFNAKQTALNGTGFVKISGTTISYDNSTYLTGNQTITLSGDISGSGTTSITTTIGAAKVTNAMLAGSIASSKLVGTDIATLGTIGTGTWQGTAIGDTYISSASTWNAKIGGSGTSGKLAKFTASGTIGDSVLQETATSIGLNGAALPDTGDTRFQINGTTYGTLNVRSTSVESTFRSHEPLLTLFLGTISNHDAVFLTNGTERIRVQADGSIITNAATDTGEAHIFGGTARVNGAATIVGNINLSDANNYIYFNQAASTNGSGLIFKTGSTFDWYLGSNPTGLNNNDFNIYSYGTSDIALKIVKSTGAATFSSSITAVGKGAFNNYTASGDFGSNYDIAVAAGVTAKGVNIGYNNTADVGFIGVVHNGTAWKNLSLQPLAGNVLIGTTVDAGRVLQVNGSVSWGNTSGEYMYAGGTSHLFAYSSSTLNVLYSGGTNGFQINNQADNNVLVSVSNDGIINLGSSLDGTLNQNTENAYTTLRGSSINAGASQFYGSYGGLVLSANNQYTASAKRFLITNALDANKFAIIRSANATTSPALGVNGGVISGVADFVISSTGNVGIGTTTPSEKLSIKGSDTAIKIEGATNSYLIQIVDSNNRLRIFDNTNNTERIAITSGGNLGIGTTTPISTHKLSVSGKIGGTVFGDSYIEFLSASGHTIVKANNDVILGYSQDAYVKQNGNLLLGTATDSGYRLRVAGDAKVDNRVYIGNNGCYIEEVAVGSNYELRVSDSAGNTTIIS